LRGLAGWPPSREGGFFVCGLRVFLRRCAGFGEASAALAGCAVHAHGARSLGAKALGLGRRLNRAILIGLTFGFWFLHLLARLRRHGLAGWPPSREGGFFVCGLRVFLRRCAGFGEASAALAGCAVHARGARSLGAKARGFGRRLNRAIPIGVTFGFWF